MFRNLNISLGNIGEPLNHGQEEPNTHGEGMKTVAHVAIGRSVYGNAVLAKAYDGPSETIAGPSGTRWDDNVTAPFNDGCSSAGIPVECWPTLQFDVQEVRADLLRM